jgi:predicted O-methyltransferase YrrM
MPIIEPKDFGRRPTSKNDISALLWIYKKKCNGNILEIGTWFGKTTYELAVRNMDKLVYTLDYMESDLHLREIEKKTRVKLKQDLCKHAKECTNVLFLYENSHEYDFDNFANVDFIFIDGDHSYEGVKQDTEKSIEYLRKNNGGAIAWHDVKTRKITEVPNYIDDLSKTMDVTIFENANIGFIEIEKG